MSELLVTQNQFLDTCRRCEMGLPHLESWPQAPSWLVLQNVLSLCLPIPMRLSLFNWKDRRAAPPICFPHAHTIFPLQQITLGAF